MRTEIQNTLEVLKEGGVILYPTDTIWGIGCDATNPDAVQRIYNIKKRDDKRSMLVLLDQEMRLPSYISIVPEIAFELLDAAVSPLTIIYPGAKNLSKNLIGEDGSIGIRITSDPFCRELISKFRKPIVSTSANQSGDPSPANFNAISDNIISQVDYVVAWRQEEKKPASPSSIIKIDQGGRITVIRK